MSRKLFFEIPPYCAQIQLLFRLRYFFFVSLSSPERMTKKKKTYILAKIMKECALKAFGTCWLRETMTEDLRIVLLYLDRMATKPCHIGFETASCLPPYSEFLLLYMYTIPCYVTHEGSAQITRAMLRCFDLSKEGNLHQPWKCRVDSDKPNRKDNAI